MLLCTVRDCRLPLTREPRRLFCERGHSFDIARSGYINLLQPQDKRSKRPGDSAEAVAARKRLHALGISQPLLEGIADFIKIAPNDVTLDAGCGDGFYLGNLTQHNAHGIDISIPSVDAAARKYPSCEWIVANADRFVPYAGRSFSVVMSITARMNAGEFRRVLRDGGRLLVALPAPDDLMELRGPGRDRTARTVETFAEHFVLAGQRRVTTAAELTASAVADVLSAIYRPMQRNPAQAQRLTFSLDLLLFQTRNRT